MMSYIKDSKDSVFSTTPNRIESGFLHKSMLNKKPVHLSVNGFPFKNL